MLLAAIREGVALITWTQDSFAFADEFDTVTGRYRALRGGQHVTLVDADASGVLVKPDVARRQLDAETIKPPVIKVPGGGTTDPDPGGTGRPGPGPTPPPPPPPAQPKRFHGAVVLDTTRVGRDASVIADEVIVHLAALVGAKVKIILEIEAEIPAGAPDNVVRTVTENTHTLHFTSQGFEIE